MWKHKNFINLQLYAVPDISFDSGSFIAAGTAMSSSLAMQAKTIIDGTSGTDFAKLEAVWTETSSDEAKSAMLSVSGLTESEANKRLSIITVGDISTRDGTMSVICDVDELYISAKTLLHGATYTCYKGTKNGTTFTFTLPLTGTVPIIVVYDIGETSQVTFKHFYDAGTIGSGTYKFRHYSQQEPSSGETWVLNDSITNDTLQYGISPNWGVNVDEYSIYQSVEFTSNNTKYYGLCNYNDGRPPALTTQTLNVYSSGWTNEAYRTITFETAPTGDLLTWLQANGTKSGGGGE